jgi:hypothetical protein
VVSPDEPSSIHGKRIRKGKGCESLRREMLQDPQLSFRALGVLVYLLSLPDTWKTDSERLAKSRPAGEGRTAIRTALRELEAAGYLRRDRTRGPQGLWVWTWRYTDDPTDLIDDQDVDLPVEDITAGQSIDQESTDRPSADGKLVDIEVPQKEILEKIGSRHSVSPSTWPLTDEDQDIACSCAPSTRWRGEDVAESKDPQSQVDNPGKPSGISAETLAMIWQGEKICRLFDFIHAAVPGGLEASELHAVESMLERGYHWRKIMGWIGKERGYDRQYTQALIDRAARSNWDLSGVIEYNRDEWTALTEQERREVPVF